MTFRCGTRLGFPVTKDIVWDTNDPTDVTDQNYAGGF